MKLRTKDTPIPNTQNTDPPKTPLPEYSVPSSLLFCSTSLFNPPQLTDLQSFRLPFKAIYLLKLLYVYVTFKLNLFLKRELYIIPQRVKFKGYHPIFQI